MAFFDWRVFFVAAAHAINEIGKVIGSAMSAGPGSISLPNQLL